MSTRDSGVIDLFAIHNEEAARVSTAPMSAPPPAMAIDIQTAADTYGPDDDLDGFAAAQAKAKRKVRLVGGLIGGFALVAAVIGGIMVSNLKPAPTSMAAEKEAAALAAQPPPPATMAIPEPAAPAKLPAPPTTSEAKDDKGGYTRDAAIAAYNASQGKPTKKAARPAAAVRANIGGGVKMTKVQSSGVSN